MTLRHLFAFACFSMLSVAGCASVAQREAHIPKIQVFASSTDARLRGVSGVDAMIAWASGSQGTVLRTLDGGAHWTALSVGDDTAKLDFRDIHAFDKDHAVALSIGPGEVSRIYRTEDGGQHWRKVLQNAEPQGFFDCMAFDGDEGWMLGDPVNGRFQVYWTGNAGRTWTLLPNGPQAEDGEAAFAASGTCIALNASGDVAIGTGGSVARVWVTLLDQGAMDTGHAPKPHWQAHVTTMPQGDASRGVFSLAGGLSQFIGVGGDFRNENQPSLSLLAFIGEPEVRIHALPETRGYRSGVACEPEGRQRCVAVGPTGVDVWDGKRWHAVSDASFDAVSLIGNTAWLSGAKGALGKLEL